MPYLDCRLTVREDPLTKERVVEFEVVTPGGLKVSAPVCHDALTKLTVERLNRWIAAHRGTCEREDLRALGQHLYRILFNGAQKLNSAKTVADAFEQTYEQFQAGLVKRNDHDSRMRLTLVFETVVDDLAAYPWEFLFVSTSDKDGFFLTGEKRELILTRAVSRSLVSSFAPEHKAINILIAVSKPRELQEVDDTVETEIDRLEAEINRRDGASKRIIVKRLVNPTHKQLRDEVIDFKPHIVHLIGHGRPGSLALFKTKDDLTLERALVQEQRKAVIEEAAWVDGNSVRAIFNTNPPRIVFLHACNSADSRDSLASFKSLAHQVLGAGVPAVVAMQYEISNDDATQFATTFYQQLGEGMAIDEAVTSGRTALAAITPAWGHPRFGTPVVYLQSDALPIFEREPDASGGRDVAGAGSDDLVPCPYSCGGRVLRIAKRCSCEKRQPLKQCEFCLKAVPERDLDCIFCARTFTKQEALSSVAVSASPPSAAATTGPRDLTR